MKTAKLIFPHQLFNPHPLAQGDGELILVEEHLFFHHFSFHRQKLAFHRASMRAFADELNTGQDIRYIEANRKLCDVRKLIPALKKEGVELIRTIDPVDDWLNKRLATACKKSGIQLELLDSPMFLNTNKEPQGFFRSDKKKFFQTAFYKAQRKERNILMEADGTPTGGKWSFDADNRKRYPKGKTPPEIADLAPSLYWQEAVQYVNKHFPDNPGELNEQHRYPVTRVESERWLKDFLTNRFSEFGVYEDAIVSNETFLNHSVLTPMLNVGLLQPETILKASTTYAAKNDIPINSTEGFVRQIMGWREFIRGVYISKGVTERNRNFWNFSRKIPKSFYDGTTGIRPLDDTIHKVLDKAYCHHIERLMVLGNFMVLCEFDPDEVYRWFMELFIDAYDWVMVPNVYGMSQFADGGLMSTKPYISSSNYILKMSNYKKEPWCETWDGLFWRFMSVHREFFQSNPRIGMLIRTWDKMDKTKQEKHLALANAFLARLN